MSLRHLTVRAAWHDSAWNGRICAAPSANSYCLDLDRIRAGRNDAQEDADAGSDITTLPIERLPACQAENGLFMNPKSYSRIMRHPYATNSKAAATHGNLRPATATVPPYSTFAIPFAWMLSRAHDELAERVGQVMPPETEAPFVSPWVFNGQRQHALLEHVFDQLIPTKSLVVFYTKSGHFYGSDVPTSVGGRLELAYALTVHKAQGSEFDVVLVIVPATGRLMSRELIYTALTRAKTRLILLVEGSDPGRLFSLASPQHSETARRNTNVFTDAVRQVDSAVPFAEHLIHRTSGGLFVRSKSELIIANLLESEGVPFRYEPVLRGHATGGYRRPDFTFASDSGDTIVWEHLGMMDRQDYRAGWIAKSAWYAKNGYGENLNLFTTREGEHSGGLDMSELRDKLKKVQAALDD